MKKFLLTLLVAFSFMFMTTNVVNAEEVTGGQTLKELDSSVLDVIDSTYHIDKKESELDLSNYDSIIKIQESVKNNYINKIKEAGYDTSKINNGIQFNVQFAFLDENGDFPDIHKINVELSENLNSIGKKVINVSYSSTSAYNQTDLNYVNNKVSIIKLQKFENMDTIWHVFDFGESAWFEKTNEYINNYNYSSLVNDKTITVKAMSGGWGTTPETTMWGPTVKLYFFKNDVLYATKDINFRFIFGTMLDNGTPVVMAKQDDNTEIYKEMAKELEKLGLDNVIGCYELEAYGDTYNNMSISFSIDSKYNGRGVKILHRKSDGTFETFDTKVVNGKATITVSEFSPFIIALTDDDPITATKLSNNAQTSSMNIIFYITLALSSLIGIAYIIGKKKIA